MNGIRGFGLEFLEALVRALDEAMFRLFNLGISISIEFVMVFIYVMALAADLLNK
jgi:hypothetical protein